MLDRKNAFDVRPVELDEMFSLDDGKNVAVMLANEVDASQLLCDEFNRLALTHASLVDTRLVTTPTLFTALMWNGVLSLDSVEQSLKEMSDARSRPANSYVARTKATLQQQQEGN